MGAQVFEIAGVQYMKVTPAKILFRSNLVHEVVTRGDCFVVNLTTGSLTVMSSSMIELAGKHEIRTAAQIAQEYFSKPSKIFELTQPAPTTIASYADVKKERARLKQLRDEAVAREEQRKKLNALFDRMQQVFDEVHK